MKIPKYVIDDKRTRLQRIAALNFDYNSQPQKRLIRCNLCGAMEHTVITHVDRYGFPAKAVACWVCGLTFLNPVMTTEAYSRFYQNIYRPLVSAYHGRTIDALTIQSEQKTYAEDLAEFIRPWLEGRSVTTLLDVGGSTGVVALELSEAFGARAAVLDPAVDELRLAARARLETIPGFLECYEPGDRRFDLVTLCQTVDHLLDASASLRKIRRLISSRGLFFVDIVDFRAAYLRERSLEAAIKIDHPYYFTEDTIDALLRRTGFRILQKNYAPDHLHVGYICEADRPHPRALPPKGNVRAFFSELRAIQNTWNE
jgi:ubiquinone/menaquinone biosynthesis C-methylase UbiE